MFRYKIFSNVKYFICKYFTCKIFYCKIFADVWLVLWLKYCKYKLATTSHHIPSHPQPLQNYTHCNPISSATIIYPNTQEPSESPPTIQNTAIKTTTSHHQSFKKLPPTTKTTTTNHLLSHSIGHHHLPKHPRAIRITTNHPKNNHQQPKNPYQKR